MSALQGIFATFTEWQVFLALVGLFYMLKLFLAVTIDLKTFVLTYVLPRISLNQADFTKKYGQWAVVTGCTQGIGRSYAMELAQRGMSVVLISRNKEKLDKLASEIKKDYAGTKLLDELAVIY